MDPDQHQPTDNAEAAELLARVHAAGVSFGSRAVEVQRVGNRVVARFLAQVDGHGDVDHVCQEVEGRLVVARRVDGQAEVAWLDGPPPAEPNEQTFARERVIL